MEYEDYLDLIAERATGRYDVPALFEEHETFERVVEDLVEPFRDEAVDAVAGLDALGFVLGTAVAWELAVGFLPIRKGDKLSVPDADVVRCEVTDYTGEVKTLEVDAERVDPGERVLVVDDWIDTAAQMDAATDLVEAAGGTVVGVAVLDAMVTDRSVALADGYRVHTVNPDREL